MRIASSQVQLSAQHQRMVRSETNVSLRVSIGVSARAPEGGEASGQRSLDRVSISTSAREARAAADRAARVSSDEARPCECGEEAAESSEEPKLRLFRLVIEALTGQRIRPAILKHQDNAGADSGAAASGAAARDPSIPAGARAGWSVAYDATTVRHEVEQTDVSARGVVSTADGKQIAFAVQVQMRRASSEAESVSVRMGDARLKDPLVLHFDGAASELPQGTFRFDLDADGTLDNVQSLSATSAMVALDRNDNGQIDDGRELFGAMTGDGFAELSVHDADQNGWIDEADPVFSQLRLWTRSTDGQDVQSSLAERGVGAIYLGRVSSPFQLKDHEGQLRGAVRSTGVWLGEDGDVGVAQQVDLAVTEASRSGSSGNPTHGSADAPSTGSP